MSSELLPAPSAVREGVSLKDYNTWKVGGQADYLASPQSLEELKEILAWASVQKLNVTVISSGSNVLISEKGLRGLVLCMRGLQGTEVEVSPKRISMTTWAGSSKAHLLKTFLEYKLPPALFLAGLPGDVGGGVVMNAGVGDDIFPREFCEIVDWIEVLRWQGLAPSAYQVERISAKKINWKYRHSGGWQPGIIVRVGVSWPNRPDPEIMKKVKLATRMRLTKQPLDMPSCGSVFRNPEGYRAGALIERAGLKGFKIGGAQVSEKHANFIVNSGGATANDIDAVIKEVRKIVRSQSGVELQTEVVYLGEW